MGDPKSKEDATKMIKAGLGKAYFEIALNCSAPLFWYFQGQSTVLRIAHSGTAFFVDAGAGPFGVTASHVIEQLRSDSSSNTRVSCYVGSLELDLLGRVIAQDAKADIATFSVTENEVSRMDKVTHAPAGSWPPRPPDDGKGVFLGGYRSRDRETSGIDTIWGFTGVVSVAHTVPGNRLRVQLNRDEFVQLDNLTCPEQNEPWGGASGGPVFAVVSGIVDTWRIAGVIAEYSEQFEVFYLSGLEQIERGGRIRSPVVAVFVGSNQGHGGIRRQHAPNRELAQSLGALGRKVARQGRRQGCYGRRRGQFLTLCAAESQPFTREHE